MRTVYRNCSEMALDPAMRRAYLHRLVAGLPRATRRRRDSTSVVGQRSIAILGVPKYPLFHSGHDVPTRGCCSHGERVANLSMGLGA
jgi:hypothetical protein